MKEYQAKSTTQVRKDLLYRSIIHYESALLQNHFLEKEVKNFFDSDEKKTYYVGQISFLHSTQH